MSESILEEAQKIIYGDREQTYGSPSKNLNMIADLWTTYLSGESKGRLTAVDVCNMMVLLKMARLINQPTHRDSIVDMAGYTALIQRCQENV